MSHTIIITEAVETMAQLYNPYPVNEIRRNLTTNFYYNYGRVMKDTDLFPPKDCQLTVRKCSNCGAGLNSIQCEYCGGRYEIKA